MPASGRRRAVPALRRTSPGAEGGGLAAARAGRARLLPTPASQRRPAGLHLRRAYARTPARSCAVDDDCMPENGELCCDFGSSAECSADSGEICCKSLAKIDSTLKSGGMCLAPAVVACPRTCKRTEDCDTNQGELCCGGLCSDACPRACSDSSDCRGQICCKTRAARSPLFPAGLVRDHRPMDQRAPPGLLGPAPRRGPLLGLPLR